MSDPRTQFEDIDLMIQQAELYETQGLYDHAMQVYRNILTKQPDNEKAKEKVAQIEEARQASDGATTPTGALGERSPRLALDLGVAYMGMNLYGEALEEFTRALKSSPAIRGDLLRYSISCLIRLEEYERARKTLDLLLADRNLTLAEKGGVVSDTLGVCLELGLVHLAKSVLERISDQQKPFVRDYDNLFREVSVRAAGEKLELEIEDTETGMVYREPLRDATPATGTHLGSEEPSRGPEPSISAETGEPDTGRRELQVEGTESPSSEEVDTILDVETLPEFPKEEVGPDAVQETATPAGGATARLKKAELDRVPRMRFACECGQVHVVPTRNTGRKGKCGSCGRTLTVPRVDSRPDALADHVIGKIIGGCRLLHKIGGGGMGGVFKGHHIVLDIPVAVKILHSHLAEKDPVFIKRFIREARAAAKLQHPNVVGVMNVGFEDGLHYLVMPYVSGGSAASELARLDRIPIDRVLDIAVDIAHALTVAEENNLLHRDIKPANILFNEKGVAMLADLGLAKSYMEGQDVGITQTGIACGTPLYFSPEQAKGSRNLDVRSDIYSLGITLYHLINGSPPFRGESAYVIFQKHVHEPLPAFDREDPNRPDSVLEVLKKMTAKNRDERFPNSRILLEALEALREEARGIHGPVSRVSRRGLLERLGIKKS
jgi:tRNA A-37 threonylcarbamoyl transferase component Bud32